MSKIKCITFDKSAQDALPEHIKAKMKADRDKARLEMSVVKLILNDSYAVTFQTMGQYRSALAKEVQKIFNKI